MKRTILAAAALVLMATTAPAASKTFTLFKGGYWQTFGMASNNDGQPMCGMQATFGGDVGRLYVKWTPQNGMTVQVWKASWRLANDTEVPFQLEFFDDAKPGDSRTITTDAGVARTIKGVLGTSVFMTVNKEDAAELLKVFGDADRLAINFPQGDEPQWTTKMDGSRKAANEFVNCMHVIGQSAATQPVTPKPTQPTGKAAPTQPQSKPQVVKRDDGSI